MTSSSTCVIHIGLDDFDLHLYGCTTHALTFLLHKLHRELTIRLIDYPNLVRLNPSIPWKTRGNGATALHIETPCRYTDIIPSLVDSILVEYYERLADAVGIRGLEPYREPGVITVVGDPPDVFRSIYAKALTDVVPPSIVLDKVSPLEGSVFVSKIFRGRGIVGAAAAIGWILQSSDYTFELIVYRSKYRYRESRCIDAESVKMFDAITSDTTFNNIDPESGRLLIVPRGFDPVLYGVRGDSVEDLKKALGVIRVCEEISAWTIFRTNQGTDAHIVDRTTDELRVYRTARLRLRIVSKPVVIPGGHVVVRGCDTSGCIDLVFFKPSRLSGVAQRLRVGDYVLVQGHVKPWMDKPCLHVEKLHILKLAVEQVCRAPRCPVCGKRMTKKGIGKGYRCKLCGYRSTLLEPECVYIERDLRLGLYIPPPAEQKHLVKPLKRYGRELSRHPQLSSIPIENVSTVYEPLWFL